MMKKGCSECERIGTLCPPHYLRFRQMTAWYVRRILPADLADMALGWICDCGARKSSPAAPRCRSCADAVPRVFAPRRLCECCGGPASKASPLCLLCRTGRTPRCAHCGEVFYNPDRQRATCSPDCSIARQAACVEASRKHANPKDADRLAKVRRRERIRAVGGAIGRAAVGRWRRICERDGWKCWICEGDINPSLIAPHRQSGTADHVIAVADGGSDSDDNLRAAHFRCNSKRQRGGAWRNTPVQADA